MVHGEYLLSPCEERGDVVGHVDSSMLSKGEMLYKNRNATGYICLLPEKKFHKTMLYKFREV